MEFYLKHFDVNVLHFSATMDTSSPDIEILWQSEEAWRLPLDLDVKNLSSWLRRRTIPKNRAFVHELLAKQGLSLNRPMGILLACKGLSLNDCYWVTTVDDTATFAQVNLYANNLSRVLAQVAFTGYGSQERPSLASSPEFTTDGMLPKCWRRQSGVVSLWKGATTGASNTGYEPYSEFYAAQIADAMGFDVVQYNLSKWKGQLCSTCPLFTSQDRAFIPVGRLVTSGGLGAVKTYYATLGETFTHALEDMLVLDALICNTDRHFGNFGVLVDTQTNQIVAPAPLFDHGNALFNFARGEYWESTESLDKYIATLYPNVYDDFLGTAKEVLRPDHHKGLRKLLTFQFKKHPAYNLPTKRLKAIEKQIQKRASVLLESNET
ncbi:XRE family transcriptional regulator [Bengtsoniella intestinalis]|uniref:XRE family transcriptional regulator n=1 Tax=Bengtsoniella intestinalis TaxID=3073143 RepID=UPI00391F79D6